jgi:hypothetical protein
VKGEGSQKASMLFKIAKRAFLHEMEEYLEPTLQKLAVGKILRTWWSDRQRGNGYFQIKFSTVGGGGGLTSPGGGQTAGYTGVGGLTSHPWRSDHLGTGAGGLTGPGGGQTVSTYFGRQKSISSDKIFQGFQPIQI